MDRTSEIFTLWSRPITIVLAVIGSFAWRIDAGYILDQITTQPAVREALVAHAGKQVSETSASSLEVQGTELQVVTNALTGTWADLKLQDSQKITAPATVTNRASAAAWIMNGASGNLSDQGLKKDALAGFLNQHETLSEKGAEAAEKRIKTIQSELAGTGLAVSRPKHEVAVLSREQRTRYYCGLLASAALLGLGAPFWFNMLKQLLGLRSQVARKADEAAKVAA